MNEKIMISVIIIKSDKNAENKPFLWFSYTSAEAFFFQNENK